MTVRSRLEKGLPVDWVMFQFPADAAEAEYPDIGIL